MSSIRVRARKDGSSYTQVMFRVSDPAEPGKTRQTSESFEDHREALSWRALLDRVGPAKARQVLNAVEDQQAPITVNEPVVRHINQLTGVEEGTITKYRGYLKNDISPAIGFLPVTLFDVSPVFRTGSSGSCQW